MSFAIIESGGKQFKVSVGAVVTLPSLSQEVGSVVEFSALVSANGEGTAVGNPAIDGTSVAATVIEHGRGEKLIVFKKKRRKQYKRKHGHRQGYTKVRIDSIGGDTDA